MAVFTGTVFSQTLRMQTGISIVTPCTVNCDDKTPYKVVYLLHGLSDNHTCWMSNTQLTLMAEEYNVVFICPEVQRSYYADMVYGLPYFTYIAEELPKICQKLFQISSKREDTYVMGLSMGGYGALKCGLTKPEQYIGCGAFSSACIPELLIGGGSLSAEESHGICGDELLVSPESNLFRLAENCQSNPMKPHIYMSCGTEDWLLEGNRQFREHIDALGYDLTYQEWEGNHNWYFWNESLRRALQLFLQK